MRGEAFIINKKILESSDCPIKETIGEYSPEKIIEIIEQEYWNEWKRLIDVAETSSVYCNHIGRFHVAHSKLRGYMWRILRELKSIRKLFKEGFTGSEETRIFLIDKQKAYKEKFRICWKQWEEQRKMFILRTIKWNNKLRIRKEENRIKYNYEQWNWSFTK